WLLGTGYWVLGTGYWVLVTGSLTCRREVVEILHGVPPATPTPANGVEGPRDHVTFHDHPRLAEGPVDILRRPAGPDIVALDERVEMRVEIDRPPVGVFRPPGGAFDKSAVEG